MKHFYAFVIGAAWLQAAGYVGNDACRPCHAEIWESYSATPMAQSSGRVVSTVPGQFRHAASGVTYVIDTRGNVRFGEADKRVQWFIGSAAAGRSFLYANEGFLYQAPVTFYAQKGAWDASPGYEHDKTTRWNRPIDANCLFCHASQARPIFGTQNRFADPPFAQAGIACERCHGPGSDHAAGKARLVNPAALDARRRDAICSQCHLSGEARINNPGRSIAIFRPGELLSDYVQYFVYKGANAGSLKATGYVEKLYDSRCKAASADKLWCGTCHDPHRVPGASEALAYYRGKCLTCHDSQECAHGRDCRSCHMPRTRAVDGGHGVLTDHSIPRKPAAAGVGSLKPWRLTAFKGFDGDPRSLGLAYAEVGLRTQNRQQLNEAVRLLNMSARDGEVMARLADLYFRQGNRTRAFHLYTDAHRADPGSMAVLVNLGIIEAERGNAERAISLWLSALERNPGLMEAATNLEILLKALDRTREAQAYVDHARRLERGLSIR